MHHLLETRLAADAGVRRHPTTAWLTLTPVATSGLLRRLPTPSVGPHTATALPVEQTTPLGDDPSPLLLSRQTLEHVHTCQSRVRIC